jgi:alkylation response protein AidB-like acyl-CoA dehydrogenase
MEAEPNEHVAKTLATIRDLFEKDVYRLEPAFASRGFRSMLPELRAIRARVKELGVWAPHLSKELGGMGLSLVEFAHVSEALGRTPIGHYLFNCQAPDVDNMEILHTHGTPSRRSASSRRSRAATCAASSR